MNTLSVVAASLKDMRKRAGLSVRAMAEAINMPTASSYQHYEDRYKKDSFPDELLARIQEVLIFKGISGVEILARLAPLRARIELMDRLIEHGLLYWTEESENWSRKEQIAAVFEILKSADASEFEQGVARRTNQDYPPRFPPYDSEKDTLLNDQKTLKEIAHPNVTVLSDVEPPAYAALALPQDVEVMGTAGGNPRGDFYMDDQSVIDHVIRPPALASAKNVYAIYVRGESMEPRFEEGETVYINPDRPPAIGDYVVIQVANGNGEETPIAYIKRLVRRTANAVIVAQFNPEEEFTIKKETILAMHRVVLPKEWMLG